MTAVALLTGSTRLCENDDDHHASFSEGKIRTAQHMHPVNGYTNYFAANGMSCSSSA
jgi:hypothetical protein